MKKAILFISMIILSGCFQSETSSVKVIDGHQLAPFNQGLVKNIQQFYNQSGEDWKDENTILVTRFNSQLPSQSMNDDGSRVPFMNLYEYNLNNKRAKLIFPERFNQINASYSPDRKHLFYHRQVNIDQNTKGMIIDLEKKIVRSISKEDIDQRIGQWTKQQRILFSPFLGSEIYEADRFGHRKRISDKLPFAVEQIAKIGQEIYLVGLDYKLYRLNGKKMYVIKENVVSFAVSPDEKKLVIRLSKPNHHHNESLMIIDRNGRELSPIIAKSGIMVEAGWSPDQSKIAYAVSSEQENRSGLFLYDVKREKSIRILMDQDTFSQLKWSPSGKKLMVTDRIEKNGKFIFVNSIITFK